MTDCVNGGLANVSQQVDWRRRQEALTQSTADPCYVVWIVLLAVSFCALADPAVSGALMRKLPWVLFLECGWCRLLTDSTYTTARIILVVCVLAWPVTIVDTCRRARDEIVRLFCKCMARAWRKPPKVQIKPKAPVTGKKPKAPTAPKTARGKSPARKGRVPPIDHIELCIVCEDATRTRVCVPCGHTVLCEACNTLETATQCPICRAPCEQMMKFYSS
jgi:hypothetical protein